MSSSSLIVLPNILQSWPFPRTVNPYYAQVAAAGTAWLDEFRVLDNARQAAFGRANFALLAALACPRLEPGHLRTVVDFLNTIFLFDDISDAYSAAGVREVAAGMNDALRNPTTPRPHGEHVLGEMHRSYWARAVAGASPLARRRFIRNFQELTDAICEEAADRDRNYIRTIPEYLALRRLTIGVKPASDLLLQPREMEVLGDILDHPKVVALVTIATDLISLTNDIYSYNTEQARGGDAHNMVAIAMIKHGLSVQQAMDYVGACCHKLTEAYIKGMYDLPPCDAAVRAALTTYISELGNWVTAFDVWSDANPRYMVGKEADKAGRRVVKLLPKQFN